MYIKQTIIQYESCKNMQMANFSFNVLKNYNKRNTITNYI